MATSIEKAQQRVKDLEDKLKQAKILKQKTEARIKTAEAKQKRADDTRPCSSLSLFAGSVRATIVACFTAPFQRDRMPDQTTKDDHGNQYRKGTAASQGFGGQAQAGQGIEAEGRG